MSGIYIHIPFCKQACHYCDFHFSTSMGKKEAMVNALQNELKMRSGELENETVETIYFGGGTPSVLSSDEINSLIKTVFDEYEVAQNPEVTLEANPDDLSKEKIKELARSPINRLSIGVQSFFEEDLRLMNRAHSAEEALESLKLATDNFDNISLDLIYGIPDMSNARWLENIETALSLGVPHISSYALTVEPQTALASFIKKGLVKNVDDAVAQEHFHILVDRLEKEGFVNYEISNFGKPNYFSRNNTAYWQQKKYLGIGPSAHSFDGTSRAWNINNNPKYIKAIEKGELPLEKEVLSVTDRYNEYVMTGLRTIWGVSLDTIVKDFGENFKKYALRQAEKHIVEHLLYLDGDVLLTTQKGKFLADGLAADLFMLNLSDD
ncbi:radical SAM family heme chaperone HemW [Euzebyella saccharophila]|uniref:Heme chaperone HemW n=1 Tax=Euzebyella saccharophila TaxID=679664 RepID=A0ABV8JPE0_9FLAO|nr:radical SAM family heme chaperone HemW [Euzebyella saccharophila]